MAKFTNDTGGTLTNNLVAYYACEDATDSTGSFNLTNNNSVVFNTGFHNKAADGGSANTNKSLTTTNSLGIDGGAITIAGWVNITTAPTSGNDNVITWQANGTSKVEYFIDYNNAGGTLQIIYERRNHGGTAGAVTVNFTLTAGTWFHIALTYDGTNVQGWKNGVSQGQTAHSGSGSTDPGTGFNLLSFSNANSLNLSGLEDEFGIWTRALGTTEIVDLYNSGNGSFYVPGGTATYSNQMMMGL